MDVKPKFQTNYWISYNYSQDQIIDLKQKKNLDNIDA